MSGMTGMRTGMNRVVVIGGGAAGLMAAVAAADAGGRVLLVEKNEKLGKKLYITGKGRCNVTNAGDMETLFDSVVSNRKFLYSAFYSFDNQALMRFLEDEGCRLKVERGDRVFPASDHSSDVIATFTRALKKRRVEIRLNAEAGRLVCGGEGIGVLLKNGEALTADSVIVATGGLSYPTTGSTGDGYRFAEEAGHSLTSCRPSLVPFNVNEAWCGEVMGLSLKNVSLRMVSGGRECYSGFGEMLFTHFGVSGPLILSASSAYPAGGRGETKLYINLKPALTQEQLDARLVREFEENRNRRFKNALGALFPAKLIPVMVRLSGIDPEKKVNEISREERHTLAELIGNVPLTVRGLRDYNEAVITKGGVSVKEVNPSTMESKRVKGLYFAGEVLDLDALTGGFNLQIAWSTGYLAGRSAAGGETP